MDFSAEALTLFILVAVAVWKARETLKDLQERASQQAHRSSLVPGGPNDRGHARVVAPGQPVPADGGPESAIARRLDDIWLADRSFYPDRFLDSARLVYETVVLAFAKGDRDVLRALLSDDVYEAFVQAIASREARQEAVEFSFIGLNRIEIVDAEASDGSLHVTVDIESQLVMATRDGAGRVVAGDPMKVTVASDRWTFAKERLSRSPAWKLAATEMPPAGERAESQMEQA